MTSALTSARPARRDDGLAARLGRLDRRAKATIIGAEVLVVLVLWQLAVGRWELVNPVFFPPPLEILGGFGELFSGASEGLGAPSLGEHVVASLKAYFIGLGLATAIGIPVGLAMGASLPVDRIVGPLAWTLYATPVLVYQPLSKAWFGFGLGPVIFLVVVSAIFPILLNTSAGIRTTNRSLVNAGRVYGASRLDLYRKVFLPSTSVYIMTGLSQASVMATVGLIAAEMTGSSVGMGALIMRSSNTFQTDQMYAAIVIVIVWSVAISQAIAAIGRRLTPWARTAVR